MLELLDTEKKTAKNLIITTLSKTWPLSAKKIYNALKKQHGLGVTYQAVYFALKELTQQGVLLCQNRKYSLSPIWVEKISAFVSELAERYEKRLYITKPKQFQALNFESIAEAFNYVLSHAETYFFGKSDLFYAYLRKLFPIPVSSDQIQKMKRFCASNNVVILCASNSAIDNLVAKFLRKIGAKVYLGIGKMQPANILVFGDSVISLYILYSKKNLASFASANSPKNSLDGMLNKDALGMSAAFANKKLRVRAIIDRDPDVKANVLWIMQELIQANSSN